MPIHENNLNDPSRLTLNGQDTDRARVAEALAVTADAEGSQGSLEKKRGREAAGYAREFFVEVANAAVFKMGRELGPSEMSALVADTVSAEQLPSSLRTEARDIVGVIATMRSEGNRAGAQQYAREAAQSFGKKLARSAWRGAPADEWDPRAAVANIPR